MLAHTDKLDSGTDSNSYRLNGPGALAHLEGHSARASTAPPMSREPWEAFLQRHSVLFLETVMAMFAIRYLRYCYIYNLIKLIN